MNRSDLRSEKAQPPPSVCVCVAGVDAFDDEPDLGQLLGNTARQRIEAISHPATRRRSQAGAALLARLLLHRLGGQASDHHLTRSATGRPEHPEAGVSISHSGDYVACAVSTIGAVGVDVQIADNAHRTLDIADAYFSADEAAWLRNAGHEGFYMLWALKEAYLKSLGIGLAGGLDRLCVQVAPPLILGRLRDPEPAQLHLHQFDNYLVGTAIRQTAQGEGSAQAPAMIGYSYTRARGFTPWQAREIAKGTAEPTGTDTQAEAEK